MEPLSIIPMPRQELFCLVQRFHFSSHVRDDYDDPDHLPDTTTTHIDEDRASKKQELPAMDVDQHPQIISTPQREDNLVDYIGMASEALDEKLHPVGQLTLEQFLEYEDTLRNMIAADQQANKTSVQQAFWLLWRLVQEHEANPDILDAEYVMQHWLYGNYPRCTKLLDDCLRHWRKYLEENPQEKDLTPEAVLSMVDDMRFGNPPLQLSDGTFRIIIQAAAKGGNPKEAPLFADRLLDRLVEESMEDPNLRPSAGTLQAVLNAWARSGLPKAPERADELFQSMTELYEDSINPEEPDKAAYLTMMQIWKNSQRQEAPMKVQEILERMKTSSLPEAEPTQGAYRLTIHSWINSGDPEATANAYDVFVELVRDYIRSGHEHMTIDGDFFSIMISTLAKQKEFDKAEEVFHLLEELYKTTKDERFEPTTKTLLGMVIAYAKSSRSGSTDKAESILLYLDDMARTKVLDDDLPPKRSYYADVVNALAKRWSSDSIQRAESLLTRMVHHHRAGVPNMLPDTGFFDQLIIAWSHSNAKDASFRAEGLLRVMHKLANETQSDETKPNEKTYLLAMKALSRSREPASAERAEKVFFEMLEHYNSGDARMKPSMMHYTTLISSWARSGHPDAPYRAQEAFEVVKGLYESGDKSFQPDCYLYTSLAQAWASVGDANSVESVFLQLFEAYTASKEQSMMPTTMSFNVLLEGWLHSRRPEAVQKNKLVYESMIEFTEEGTLNVPPDIFTYSLMIETMIQSDLPDAAEQAEEYLEAMKAAPILFEESGHGRVFRCYASTIYAWSKRHGDIATAKVETLTNELINLSKSRKIPLPNRKQHRRFLNIVAKSGVPVMALRAKEALDLGNKFRITRNLLPKG